MCVIFFQLSLFKVNTVYLRIYAFIIHALYMVKTIYSNVLFSTVETCFHLKEAIALLTNSGNNIT